MSPERWPQIKGLFQAALDIEPAERTAFLRHRCGSDEALHAAVSRLLEQHDRSTILPGERPSPEPPPMRARDEFGGGRYRVENLAGVGGMGEVFRAHDVVLKRPVAIKVLTAPIAHTGSASGPLTSTGGRVGRDAAGDGILREARAMAAFAHPCVCRVLDVVTEPGPAFIVMEWIEGVDLTVASRPLGREERLSMLLKIVDAVAAMHAAGLVHRDLKPANILVTARGEPMIVDFGLAVGNVVVGGDGVARLRGGTPGYAAPEQFMPAEGGGGFGPTADVYALGVVMYELLTDHAPYPDASPLRRVERARTEDPPLPEVLAPECPAALQRVCLAAMERDPSRRYPTARQMADDLRRYFRGESVLAHPSQLAAQFTEQIESQLDHTKRWARLGMITDAEATDLRRRLTRMLRPESPWIVDSRRLSHSQVSLHLGSWIALVGLSVGMLRSWDVLPQGLRMVTPPLVALLLLGAGAALHLSGHLRVALVYLVTVSLATPLALDLGMRQSGALSNGGAGMGPAELFGGTEWRTEPVITVPGPPDRAVAAVEVGWEAVVPPLEGLFNAQLFAAAVAWLVASSVLRIVTRSSAFSLLAMVALVGSWGWLWLLGGGYGPPRDERTVALLGAWSLPLSAALIVAGARLSSAELVIGRRVGHSRTRRNDSWPLLSIGVGLAVGALSTIAYTHPQWMLLPRFIPEDDGPVSRIALAFMCSGVALLGLSWYLSRHPGEARTRMAVALRWILPSHFLASLLWLSVEDAWGLGRTWLIVAAAASVVVCYVSVIKQWKPFVINGLVYLAAAYFRAFDDHAVRDSRTLQVVIAIGGIAVGLSVMAAAWWLPDRLASEHVRRVLSRAQARLSGPRRGGGPARPA